mmetsp:Transcript_31318/g.30978  ORF Transcript_31318/g.30978 Transcript_31318/m.30978 type:complete len:726 (+) Transcript_31318:439-2616(+)
MIPPHSCGEICGRKRGEDCPHLCPQQCHPGACPPCTSMAPIQNCPCGKTMYQTLCKDKANIQTCENICDKILACRSHRCQEKCHAGECKKCGVKNLRRCPCDKEEILVDCGVKEISCGNKCEKMLSCGNHKCQKICHEEYCGDCEFLPSKVSTCPCGKNSLDLLLIEPRSSCLDPIPSCYMPCNKTLPCGHSCKVSCHIGKCPPCTLKQEVPCRCGLSQGFLTCSELTSGKTLLCNKPCNTKKSCKKHRCQEICCSVSGEKHHPFHQCTEICRKVLNCGIHSCLLHCHLGNCEPCSVLYKERKFCACGKTYKDPPLRCGTSDLIVPCTEKCSKPLPCGHNCQSICHPGECPPCFALIEKPCKCGKMYRPVQCNVKTISCGKPCMNPKKCGHLCTLKCHSGECELEPCTSICGKKKPSCDHTCILVCHEGPCPISQCEVGVKVYCSCKMQFEIRKCYENKEKECTAECESLQRAKNIQEALGSGHAEDETYSESLVGYGKANPDFLSKLEKKLDEILTKKTKVNFLPQMKAEHRAFCHELIADHYNLETLSLDQEPYRSVLVYMTENAKKPKPLLSHFINLVKQGIVKEPDKAEYMASLLFYQLSAAVVTDDLLDILQKYQKEFIIEWVNDHSAYAHFYSYNQCNEAYKMLQRIPGQYSVVKMINHTKTEGTEGFKKKFRNTKKKAMEFTDELPDKPQESSVPIIPTENSNEQPSQSTNPEAISSQ